MREMRPQSNFSVMSRAATFIAGCSFSVVDLGAFNQTTSLLIALSDLTPPAKRAILFS